MIRVFINGQHIINEHIELLPQETHHLKNVLRKKSGDFVILCDGGTEYKCQIVDIANNLKLKVKVIEKNEICRELSSQIFLFQGLPKGEKFEIILQKSVELGVSKIIPFISERCISKPRSTDGSTKKLNRYNKIALAAAKQSQRSIIPEVLSICTFEEAVRLSLELDLSIICYEREEKCLISDVFCDRSTISNKKIGIFIGPEGGFGESEIELAVSNNVISCSLGNRILRTETVSLYVMSILNYLLSD